MAKGKQVSGAEILRFLDAHRLDHSPGNYAFAHRVLFEADVVLKREVGRITDGGVRITPEEVAKLGGIGAAGTPQDNAPQLDRLTVRVLDIIGDAALATGHLNRDLVGAAASLVHPDGLDVRTIITAMIDRTAKAEASLSEATRQAQSLREELNALRSDASLDRLTGLLNRQGVEDQLVEAVSTPKGCAIALIGVDHMAAINGAHGHAVGGRVLKAVADELVTACGSHVVARWGGDTFVIVADGYSASMAGAVVERALACLSSRHLKVRESDASIGFVTFSAGVAASRGRSVAELVSAADALLHRAKNRGRSRVEVEPALVPISQVRSS